MTEYRPVPDDDEDPRARITRYAFAAGRGPYDPGDDLDERRQRMWAFGEDRGMYDGDDLLVTCSHIEFTTRLRGTDLPMVGLTAVASPPEHRRRGLVGEMLAASLSEYRDREWPLSVLYPFDEEFYARYGWATGCRYRSATVEPDALSIPVAATGEFRRIDPDEYDRIEPVYEAWREGIDLAVDRTADWWRDRVFQGFENELYCYAWEDGGDPRGYLVYDVTDDDGGRLETTELAYADHEAFLHLLRFCRNHDSQLEDVRLSTPAAGRVVDLVDDRGAVTVEEGPGAMVRIVDVPAALEAVPYPGVADAEIVLDVGDDHAPWNDARFALRVADGAATVTETDADPDAALDIGALSQLLVGYRSPDRLRVEGALTVHDPGAVDTLAALFPERAAFLPDRF